MKLITTKEAAKLLCRSTKTIRRWYQSGKLPVASFSKGKGGKNGKIPLFSSDLLLDIKSKNNVHQSKVLVDTSKTALMDTMSTNQKAQNNDTLGHELWLDFDTVLDLYRASAEKVGNSITDEKHATSEVLSSKKEEKITLEDIFSALMDTTSGVNDDKLEDMQKSGSQKGSKSNSSRLVDIDDKLEDKESKSKYSAEWKRVRRDIESKKLLTRRDPKDKRKTQILFLSLSASLQKEYQLQKIKTELAERLKNPVLFEHYNKREKLFSSSKSHISSAKKIEVVTILYTTPTAYRPQLVAEFCQLLHTHKATIYRWIQKCLMPDGSLDTGPLLKINHGNKGREKQFSQEIKRYFQSCLCNHALFSVSFARKMVNAKFCCQMSRRQADKLVKNDPYLFAVWQSFHRADKSRFSFRHFTRQTREKMRPLSVVTTDGHILDVKIKSPNGDFRPTIVEVLDVATYMPLGWAIGREEDRETTNRALINALQKYGHFETILVDLGKAFWQDETTRKRIYDYLHVSVVSKIGYAPNLKAHQERNFGELERCVGQLLGRRGYIGNSVAARQKKSASQDMPAVHTYAEIYEIINNYYEIIAPNRLQSGLHGKSAKQMWQYWEKAGFSCKRYCENAELEYQAFLLALGKRLIRKTKNGWLEVTINGQKIYYSSPTLPRLDGQKVELVINPDNPNIGFVIFGGKLFGKVTKYTLPKVGQHTPQIKQLRRDSEYDRKQMMAKTKAQLDKLDLVAEQNKYLYQNATGFQPEWRLGEVTSAEFQNDIKVLSQNNKKAISNDIQKMEEISQNSVAGLFESSIQDSDVQKYEVL